MIVRLKILAGIVLIAICAIPTGGAAGHVRDVLAAALFGGWICSVFDEED